MTAFDKLKAQTSQVDQSVKDAGKAAGAKLGEAEAKLKTHGLLHDLGEAVYKARTAQADPGSSVEIDRLVAEIAHNKGDHLPAAAVAQTTPKAV